MGTPPFLSPFLQAVLVISLTKISPSNCCPIRSFSCGPGEKNLTPPKVASCGSHNFRCENSILHMQFYARGRWYPTGNITYPENTLIVSDPWLGEKLGQTHCHIFYKFNSPVPNFVVGEMDHLMLFDCNSDSYDFSRDFFYRNYGCSNCGDYDLYYSHYRQTLEDLPATCTTPSDGSAAAVEWVLNFQELGETGVVNFSLKSVGFSPRRRAVVDCFDCKIRSGNCATVRAENSSCTCGHFPCPDGASNKKGLTIGLAVGGVFLGLALAGCGCGGFVYCRKYRTSSTLKCLSNENNVEVFLNRKLLTRAVKQYRYAQVKKMTKGFKEQLGQGGYGTVYKGRISDGSLVAVKILRQTNRRGEEEEFINEVCSIGRTNHVNVVTLLGFCSQGSRRALIYEFMPNGSLDKFLFAADAKLKTFLDWEKLHNIAIGIASGLEYLHRGCKTPMLHFDIKPHNILLDEDLCPKISDFGLAKFYKLKESILSSMACARGTIGYIAPEVFSRSFGAVSSKSDVYSYGMVILEMVGRRRNVVDGSENTSEVYFPHWIYEHLDEYCAGPQETVDSIEGGNSEIARRMALVGLWCIQTSPTSRPSISRVVEMLKGDAGNLAIPPKPYICSPERSGRSSNIEDIATFTFSSSG